MGLYADADYYKSYYGGTIIPDSDLNDALNKACGHINILTFNRIAGKGFDSLTGYQQNIIRECCCEMADFEYENADIINSVLQSYSINGVSMTFAEGWNMKVECGVAVKRDTYAKLQSTGLCCCIIG